MSKADLIQHEERQAIAPVVTDSAAIMAVIERAATNPDVDLEKMERLLVMHERITARNAEAEFNAAMTDAQAEMRPVSADASNPQTRSKYASYAALDKAMRPIYTRHGFSLSFDTDESPKPDHIRVVCYVSHGAGHSRTHKTDMPADGKGAKGGDVMTKTHAAGSAMSYGMRYLLKMIFNVAVGEDDDDGNGANAQTITPEQVANLEALISETASDRAGFLRFMDVTSLEQIGAKHYTRGVKALERKKAVEEKKRPAK